MSGNLWVRYNSVLHAVSSGGTSSGGGTTAGTLTWSPPLGWENYTELIIPTQGGSFTLDSATDYKVSAPTKVTGTVWFRGGRNIVWLAGHVELSNLNAPDELTSTGIQLGEHPTVATTNGRIIHIEGVRIDGDSLGQGLRLDAPTAIVQLQNIHIGTVRFKNCDHRDGTNGLSINHPDIIQTYGSQKELRIDGLTGSSAYQGLFLKEDHTDRALGPMYFRRVNLKSVEVAGVEQDGATGIAYAGHRMISKYSSLSGTLHIDPATVWVQHHVNSGWASGAFRKVRYWHTDGYYQADPVLGTSTFADAIFDDAGATTTGTDATGVYATLGTSVVSWDGSTSGKIYSGAPSGGDYVPANTVGLSYVSPGYV